VELLNAGGDTINAIKQAQEFGLTDCGETLAALVVYAVDVHAIGLQTPQGLVLTGLFYWDLNPRARAFSDRFSPRNADHMPTMSQAGVYSGLLHQLNAVAATTSIDPQATIARMKAKQTDDPLFGEGTIRTDGRKVHPM